MIATAEGVLTAVGACITALALLVTAIGTLRIRRDVAATKADVADTKEAVSTVEAKVDKVHGEIATENGLSLGALADRDEGRRIEAEVPEADRTPAEAAYVAAKSSPHKPKP